MRKTPDFRVVKTLSAGALKIDIAEYADGRFGFDWKDRDGARKQVRKKVLRDAVAAAQKLIGVSQAGKLDLLSLDPSEVAEFLAWKTGRRNSLEIETIVSEFLTSKKSRNLSRKHLRDLLEIEKFASQFRGQLDLVPAESVERWLDRRQVGPRRWNNLLAVIKSLYVFARRRGYLGEQRTPVEAIERKPVEYRCETYSPAELEKILAAVQMRRRSEADWLPYIVLGAFCGIRPEEIAPEPKTGKQGLRWASVDWARRNIDMPATVSKTRKRRFIPLCDAAIAWLDDYTKATGPIAPQNSRACDQTAAWSRKSGVEWRFDGLRHSYASYKLALTKDAPALALEMGNSATMIFRHYLDLKHREEAEKWFGVRPVVPRNVVRISAA